jgi:hypothetical protein
MIKLKKLLLEGGGCSNCTRPRTPLAEMPKGQLLWYLNDDWKEKAENFLKTNTKKGTGYNNLIQGLEKLSNIGHELLTTRDFLEAFGFTGGNFNFNQGLKKDLVKLGIIASTTQKPTENPIEIETDPEDEWSVGGEALPGTDIGQGIDLDYSLKKIKIDPKAAKITIEQKKTWEIPQSELEGTKIESARIIKIKRFHTSKFKFLKPYIEDKYSQKIVEPIELGSSNNWRSKLSNKSDLDKLFPDRKDFISYMKKYFKNFKTYNSPGVIVEYKTPNYTWNNTTTVRQFQNIAPSIDIQQIMKSTKPTISYELQVN